MANTVQNGKGSKRRKKADDVSFNDNFDKIDWSTTKSEPSKSTKDKDQKISKDKKQ